MRLRPLNPVAAAFTAFWLAGWHFACLGCRDDADSIRNGADSVARDGSVMRKTSDSGEQAQLVGHQRCAECHADIAQAHATTGHARTFAGTGDSDFARKLCDASVPASGDYGAFSYACDEQGLTVASPDRFPAKLFPLDYAFGSGDHAVTFLTLLTDVTGETVGIEHRMTWYRSDEQLDVTPGQTGRIPQRDVELFGRIIAPKDLQRCVDCHTTSATITGDRLTNVVAGVHCEECHGPGSHHVQAALQRDEAAARSLIQKDWTAAEEIAVCGRCHRMPSDIAPERLKAYPRSVRRFQPVGLLQSACYLKSKGELGCTTCHDPHRPVHSRTAAEQVATCLTCHGGETQTHCPVSPQKNCIECHMPAIDLVRGIEFHDHWIRVHRDEPEASASPDSAESDHASEK